jgi:hypothetical protein
MSWTAWQREQVNFTGLPGAFLELDQRGGIELLQLLVRLARNPAGSMEPPNGFSPKANATCLYSGRKPNLASRT